MGASALSFAVVGACLALSAWYFMKAVSAETVGFDRDTLDDYGILFSLVIFLFTGPVLALRAFWAGPSDRLLSSRLAGVSLFALWSSALGMTAIGMAARLLP